MSKVKLAGFLADGLELEELEPIIAVVVEAGRVGKKRVSRDEARLWLLGERLVDPEVRWKVDACRRSSRLRARAAVLTRAIRNGESLVPSLVAWSP